MGSDAVTKLGVIVSADLDMDECITDGAFSVRNLTHAAHPLRNNKCRQVQNPRKSRS